MFLFPEKQLEKVEMRGRELGYQLPGHKNKKENKKEKMIVVFCPTITSPYYVMLLQGIEAVANERATEFSSAIPSVMPGWKRSICA